MKFWKKGDNIYWPHNEWPWPCQFHTRIQWHTQESSYNTTSSPGA